MRRHRACTLIVLLAALGFEFGLGAAEHVRLPLRVLYLARTKDDTRTAAFSEFLNHHFATCRTERREAFQRDFTNEIDVVVLDWSQDERLSNEAVSPIGPLDEWKRPIVALGSAGLLLSKPWKVIGDAG